MLLRRALKPIVGDVVSESLSKRLHPSLTLIERFARRIVLRHRSCDVCAVVDQPGADRLEPVSQASRLEPAIVLYVASPMARASPSSRLDWSEASASRASFSATGRTES